MTRLIERWFPCSEVSENSTTGWGSGNTERNLFTWFAARPTAQAKAAMLCSLLPWPDDVSEQERLKQLVRDAMTGRYACASELERELARSPYGPQNALDPFSGRGIIPMEGARLGVATRSVDYSPVAVLASRLLCDFPFRDWSEEPTSTYQASGQLVADRLVEDAESVLAEIGRRYSESMSAFYPEVAGMQPWGYLWCITLPCQECGVRFPLYGSSLLQSELAAKKGGVAIPAQYLALEVDRSSGTFRALSVGAAGHAAPTLANSLDPSGRKVPGKSAICPFCGHVHPTPVHRRLANQGLGHDHLLLVADTVLNGGKLFREPTAGEVGAAESATVALRAEPSFSPITPARPNELIGPGNNNIVGPVIYGARSYGDLMNDRQTLGFVRLSRAICEVAQELRKGGSSDDYVRAMTGYASSVLVRRLRRATRGATLMSYSDGRATGINNIYVNEGSITFSYDYLETGLGGGAGSWEELSSRTLNDLRKVMPERPGRSTVTDQGSATDLGLKTASVSVVVTDPPYDEMIAYADSSDILYVWLKRCLANSWPELAVTADPTGTQDKGDCRRFG